MNTTPTRDDLTLRYLIAFLDGDAEQLADVLAAVPTELDRALLLAAFAELALTWLREARPDADLRAELQRSLIANALQRSLDD